MLMCLEDCKVQEQLVGADRFHQSRLPHFIIFCGGTGKPGLSKDDIPEDEVFGPCTGIPNGRQLT